MKRKLKPRRREEEDKPLLTLSGAPLRQSDDSNTDTFTSEQKYHSVEIAMTDNQSSERPERNAFIIEGESFREKVNRIFFGKTRSIPRIFSIPYLPKEALERQAKIDTLYAAEDEETAYYNRIEAEQRFPENTVRNQKYNVLTFIPCTLYEQFKYFYNIYFLGIALTQFVPILKVGFLFTFVVPLAFVLALSIGKEGYDDIKRMIQDKKCNSQQYKRLMQDGTFKSIAAADIRVGYIIAVDTNCRIPADMALLKTTDKSGASFIRTDQLDGETDWKLRRPLIHTQNLSLRELSVYRARIFAEAPGKDIYSFTGKFQPKDPEDNDYDGDDEAEPITVENMLWSSTVVATGQIVGVVVYTGKETRTALNRTAPKSKRGKTEEEINTLSKILFAILAGLSILMVAAQGFSGLWYVYFIRFMILFSAIIPISMRVNLDMAKLFYAYVINKDDEIPGAIVRNSNIPEELGRINFLFTDKTGTLTQNEMNFKKLHCGSVFYRDDDILALSEALNEDSSQVNSVKKIKKGAKTGVMDCVRAIALCHNVTPVLDPETGDSTYQASSPDEVALVKFTESVGVVLKKRDLHTITLNENGIEKSYEVLHLFPFSSATKRMGIVVRDESGKITFMMKGADVVMLKIISDDGCEWMEEETGNMAREGLRTLVYGYRDLSIPEYEEFTKKYREAECSMENRDANKQRVIETFLEKDMHSLCVTGVEDKLQDGVRQTLELLQQAGIKIWMLTGDKVETATCIAISAKLFKPTHTIKTITAKTLDECKEQLDDFAETPNSVLVIDGNTLQMCLDNFQEAFISAAQMSPSVVCCRCSPTQKAEIVNIMKQNSQDNTVAAIGDGGNDVSMILEADVGIGIEGKEGKQASLAADFSITQFSHIARLIMWHGRNSYKRSASLSQFIVHRGVIISVIQAIYSALFFFAAVAIYQGWLLVGYATFYTMAPVFSLVLDKDVSEDVAMKFPELYSELQRKREISVKTFTWWMFTSVFQGGMIMICAILLFENKFANIVTITFTVLILTELLNIAFKIHTWNLAIVLSEIVTVLLYALSTIVLPEYFSMSFILTWGFWWKVALSTAISCLPISLTDYVYRLCFPDTWSIVDRHSGSDDNRNFADIF